MTTPAFSVKVTLKPVEKIIYDTVEEKKFFVDNKEVQLLNTCDTRSFNSRNMGDLKSLGYYIPTPSEGYVPMVVKDNFGMYVLIFYKEK